LTPRQPARGIGLLDGSDRSSDWYSVMRLGSNLVPTFRYSRNRRGHTFNRPSDLRDVILLHQDVEWRRWLTAEGTMPSNPIGPKAQAR
jgi:hypothetical protein